MSVRGPQALADRGSPGRLRAAPAAKAQAAVDGASGGNGCDICGTLRAQPKSRLTSAMQKRGIGMRQT